MELLYLVAAFWVMSLLFGAFTRKGAPPPGRRRGPTPTGDRPWAEMGWPPRPQDEERPRPAGEVRPWVEPEGEAAPPAHPWAEPEARRALAPAAPAPQPQARDDDEVLATPPEEIARQAEAVGRRGQRLGQGVREEVAELTAHLARLGRLGKGEVTGTTLEVAPPVAAAAPRPVAFDPVPWLAPGSAAQAVAMAEVLGRPRALRRRVR